MPLLQIHTMTRFVRKLYYISIRNMSQFTFSRDKFNCEPQGFFFFKSFFDMDLKSCTIGMSCTMLVFFKPFQKCQKVFEILGI